MATQRLTTSYLLESMQGVHVWGTDAFRLALYDGTSALSEAVTAYQATNEVTGSGYTAGGIALVLAATFPKIVDGKAAIDFDDISVNPASFNFRYGLIYNSSKANRSVAVIDWGQIYSVTTSLLIRWPDPVTNPTIRSAAAQ